MILFRYLLLVVFSFATISLNGGAGGGFRAVPAVPTPPEWFQPEKQQESCPDLSGIYYNIDKLDSETQYNPSLFTRLIPSLSPAYAYCYVCTVDFRWFDDEKNTLSVTIVDPTGNFEPTTRQLKKSSGDFRCENGALIIDYKVFLEGLGYWGGYTSGTNRFYKGSDGTVMCEQNYSYISHWDYWFPSPTSSTSFYDRTKFLRWRQYAPAPLVQK